jgi:hypothetical protein
MVVNLTEIEKRIVTQQQHVGFDLSLDRNEAEGLNLPPALLE